MLLVLTSTLLLAASGAHGKVLIDPHNPVYVIDPPCEAPVSNNPQPFESEARRIATHRPDRALTRRAAPPSPLRGAGGVRLGVGFIALALYTLRSTWRSGIDGRGGRALGLGVGGGIAAIIGAGCISGAIILFLLSQSN